MEYKCIIKYIIRKLFCPHEWEFKREFNFFEEGDSVPANKIIIYICKKCGNFKKIKI
jgi:hypothetical protein